MDPSTGDASLPQQIRTPNNSGVMKIGRARGPLNLWSVEAREDMFNRREAGEGWETICPDFPNRSRHAMQQQFSMMKKQKAQAEGTYVHTRRRRRKRKQQPSETVWDSTPKNPYSSNSEGGLKWTVQDVEEEEGLSDYSSEEENDSNASKGSSDDEDETRSAYEQGGSSMADSIRLPMPPRSLTEPTRHRNSKIVKLSTVRSSTLIPQDEMLSNLLADDLKTSTGIIQLQQESDPQMHPPKKQKISLEAPNGNTEPFVGGISSTTFASNSTGAMLNAENIEMFQKILQEGIERAHNESIVLESKRASIRKTFEAERILIKETFEMAASRSNRRIRDIQDVLRDATRRQAEQLKEKEKELAESLARLKTDRKQWEREQVVIMKAKDQGLAETLAKMEGQRKQLVEDNSNYFEENRLLKLQLKPVEDASNKVTKVEAELIQLEERNATYLEEIQRLKEQLELTMEKCSKAEDLEQILTELAETKKHVILKNEQLTEREEKLVRYHDLSERVHKELRSLQECEISAKNNMKESTNHYQRLATTIKALKNDWNSLPYNELMRRFTQVELEAEGLATPLSAAARSEEIAFAAVQRIFGDAGMFCEKDSIVVINGTSRKDDPDPEPDAEGHELPPHTHT